MGFWNVAGKVAKGVGNLAIYAGKKAYGAAENYMEEVNDVRGKIAERDMSDEDVMHMYRTSHGAKKIAARLELKDRGLI